MWKKSVCGLTILVAGLLVWSCGDGSVDSLSDNELMMISRFPSTIDYDMLDSVVNACKNDAVCWEKAKKTGEIYKGDYTKVLRDSSGNIVVVEGDSAYIWKDGKKLPVFDFSSNSAGDDDDVTSSGSTSMSASSTGRSSSSVSIEDDVNNGGSQGSENGSSGGTSSRAHAEESSSGKSAISSSSIDASQYTNASSSSLGVYSGATSSHSRSSSSQKGSSSSEDYSYLSSSVPPEVDRSSATVVESSSSKNTLSAGSESSHGGGNLKCGETPVEGTCKPNKDQVVKGTNVTYTYVPEKGSCQEESAILWLAGDSDASVETQNGGWTFTVSFAKVGSKTGTYFIMENTRIPCEDVLVVSDCNTPNRYECVRTKIPADAYDNIWKNSPRQLSYKWEVQKTNNGCFEIISYDWGGALTGESSASVTKVYTSAINQAVSVKVTDENKDTTLTCGNAYATYVEEKAPTCSMNGDLVKFVDDNFTVTPKSISGCDYDTDKCDYTFEGGSTSDNGGGYGGGSLTVTGESTSSTVPYTLTLTNKRGSGSCSFNVEYVVPTATATATTSFEPYEKSEVYKVSVVTISNGNNKFKCTVSSTSTVDRTIGTFDGVVLKIPAYNNPTNTVPVSDNSTHMFVVADEIPEDLTCGLLNW